MNALLLFLLHKAEVPVGKIPLAGEIEFLSWRTAPAPAQAAEVAK